MLYGDRSYAPSLVLSMRYLHSALAAMGFQGSVKVSSADASSVSGTPPAVEVPPAALLGYAVDPAAVKPTIRERIAELRERVQSGANERELQRRAKAQAEIDSLARAKKLTADKVSAYLTNHQ